MGLKKDITAVPQLARGQVWCRHCGGTRRLNGPNATLGGGWPKCCGFTMTIDSPKEQAEMAARQAVLAAS